MNDKQWLDRVKRAALVYEEANKQSDVLNFVEWLHKQYGYVYNTSTKSVDKE